MDPSSPPDVLIDARDLTKRYGPFTAVDGLTMRVGAGEVVGFLGPNGAGKTTTMRMLTTYLPPTEGSAKVCGFDVVDEADRVRTQLGYLPETPPLYPEMRVEGYLRFVAKLKGVARADVARQVDWALEACALTERRRQVIATLSKGFRQRVGIAQAIIHDPKVLILDEPTSGLDPNQIIEIRHLIRTLAAERTIMLSTHIMQEVIGVCDRVLILHEGRLVHDGAVSSDLEATFIRLTARTVTEAPDHDAPAVPPAGADAADHEEVQP